jgi:hypothetical protein
VSANLGIVRLPDTPSIKNLEAEQLTKSFTLFIARVAQVIHQTQRRVLNREKVPSSEKLVSLFESHSDIATAKAVRA